MRIRLSVPEAHVDPYVLDSALEAVTRTDESLIRNGVVPDADEAIKRGVVWRPEPPGDEHFDPATTVVARGHGDCDDLAPYKAASLRVRGEDPYAVARVVETHPGNYHAVVQRSDGTIDDPSADAGMYSYVPPVQPQMNPGADRPHVSFRAVGNVHVARCDVPWQGTRMHISGHGWGHTFEEAVTEAVQGACVVGSSAGAISSDHAERLMALNALLAQCAPREVESVLQAWGRRDATAVVGSIVGALRLRPTKKVVSTTYSRAVHGVDMLGELVKHLTSIAVQHGVPESEARAHAVQAAQQAMVQHGAVSTHVVGSLFGSLLKTGVSLLPVPGAGLISNLMPDIDPFGGGGGGGGAPAPAPAARPAAPPMPGMMPGMAMSPVAAPGGGSGPPVTHPPPVVVPIITRF